MIVNASLERIAKVDKYYKDCDTAREHIAKNIELIKYACTVSLQHLKVLKATLPNNISELPNDENANEINNFEIFFTKHTIPSEEMDAETKLRLDEHLKSQQIAMLKEIYTSLKSILGIINYPEHENYLFNPDKDWEECIDVAIDDLEELIANNKLFNHKPKNLFLKNYDEDYYLNHVDKIKEFGKGITYPMREIRRIIEIE